MAQRQVWAQTNPLLEGRGVEGSKNQQLLTSLDTGDRDVNSQRQRMSMRFPHIPSPSMLTCTILIDALSRAYSTTSHPMHQLTTSSYSVTPSLPAAARTPSGHAPASACPVPTAGPNRSLCPQLAARTWLKYDWSGLRKPSL